MLLDTFETVHPLPPPPSVYSRPDCEYTSIFIVVMPSLRAGYLHALLTRKQLFQIIALILKATVRVEAIF